MDDGYSWGNESMESMGKEPPFETPLFLFLKDRSKIKGYAIEHSNHEYDFFRGDNYINIKKDILGWKLITKENNSPGIKNAIPTLGNY